MRAPGITSTRRINGTGLKKCSPATRDGSCSAAAIAVTGSELVLVASTVCAGQTFSKAENSSRLVSRSSRTASMTRSHSWSGASGSPTGCSRSFAAAASSAVILPLATSLSNMPETEVTASLTASARTSASSVVIPPAAASCAMPRPITPAPTTRILRTSRAQRSA